MGDGDRYAAKWGSYSSVRTARTALCAPPPPSGLSADPAGTTTVELSWREIGGDATYEAAYRKGTSGSWISDADDIDGGSHTVGGLECDTTYSFSVRAHGDGSTYAAEWGEYSPAVTATTEDGCVPDPPGTRSGELAASLTTMDVGQSTTVRAGEPGAVRHGGRHRLPSGQHHRSERVSRREWSAVVRGVVAQSDGDADGVRRGATVRLLASGDRHELDTLAITIMSNGTVTLTPADPVVGTIIDAALNDPDDPVANSKTWGWERSPDRVSWSGVYGATNSSYMVAEEDRGKDLRADVTYDDDHGSGKRAASAPVEISEGCSVRSLGTITGTEEVSGNWASDCQSVNRTGRYARFYSFSVGATSEVRIDLTSSGHAYLFLSNCCCPAITSP